MRKRHKGKPKHDADDAEGASHPQQTNRRARNHDTEGSQRDGEDHPRTIVTIVGTWSQVALTIITAIYVALTYQMWRAMLDANRSSREMFEASQRARIAFGSVTPRTLNLKLGEKIAVTVQFKNVGRSVAHVKETVTRSVISDIFVPAEGYARNLRPPAGAGISDIAPEQIFTLDGETPVIGPIEYPSLNSRAARIFVLAHVKYDDGFGRLRELMRAFFTESAMRVGERAKQIAVATKGSLFMLAVLH
jgi:hypothetical protein